MREALERIVAEELNAIQFELVRLRVGGTKTRPVLEVRIDRLDQGRVTVDDCARASRALEARLESDGSIGSDRYVLEVSSPGMDRPLVRAADWRRFVGRRASVKSAELGGRVEVEIQGVEGPDGAEVVTVRDAAGVDHRLSLSQVIDARLAIQWP